MSKSGAQVYLGATVCSGTQFLVEYKALANALERELSLVPVSVLVPGLTLIS